MWPNLIERSFSFRGGIAEVGEAAAFLRNAGDVDVGDHEFWISCEAFAFGDLLAHLVGDDLAVPGEIGRALAAPGGSEHVGGDGAARLAIAENGAIFGFADDDVGCGEIEQMLAPASAPYVDGGMGDQKSSQISTWKLKSRTSLAVKIRSAPKYSSSPQRRITSSSVSPATAK